MIRRVADDRERCPDGARPLDLGQRTLMPGLTDAHTHASGHVPHTAKGAEDPLPGVAAHFLQAELRDYLRLGVTTIRVCGSQGMAPQEARQAMRYGAFRGPRLLTCGKIISATAPGGRFYGDMYREADGPDDIRRAVREQIRQGADFVKVMTTGARSNELEDPEPLQLTEPELAAVTDEAHRLGTGWRRTPRAWTAARRRSGTARTPLSTACTCTGGRTCWRRWPPRARSWCPRCRATTGWPAWASPSTRRRGPDAAAADPEAPHADPGMPPVLTELARHNLAEGAASMRAARQAGVKIALGSDVSLATGLEIQRMVEHGLTPGQALAAATGTAAQALGLDDHLGTVAEGKLADLIVVDGDPLACPRCCQTPAVSGWSGSKGVPVAGQALDNQATERGR